MFKRKLEEQYHPADIDNASGWLICHSTVGAIEISPSKVPAYFSDVAPMWVKDLTDSKREIVHDCQLRYVADLLRWMDANVIIDAFIEGGYEKREKEILNPLGISSGNHFKWDRRFVDLFTSVNVYNLYLKAKDGSQFIAYDTGWETIFILDANKTLPGSLREPTIHEAELR